MLNEMKSRYAGKIIFVCCLLFVVSGFLLAQSREEKLQQLKNRTDIKVTEIEKGILKLEYPNGKVLIKNIADYQHQEPRIQHPAYSPTYDSTIIDLTTIDTTLYYQKYSFWQEVPINNWQFDHILIGDVNNNGRPELYGPRKFFWTEQEPVAIYELNEYGSFDFKYQYDSVSVSRNIYDVDNDELADVQLSIGGTLGIPMHQRFFSRKSQDSLATKLNFIFAPYTLQSQLNDLELGDFDGDELTDLLFVRALEPDIHIYEYNPTLNNFDSIYQFNVYEDPPWANAGFSVSDFDLDGKTDMVFGTGKGAVYVLENEGNNQYTNSWLGMVETYHAYVHSWSHDIDGNGKPEFWVLGDAFYNGQAVTRITLFETNEENSYQVVGRIDLIGVFSFYAGTMQAVDVDNDGIDEVAVCIDDNFLILEFNGSTNHQTYELFYIKSNDLWTQEEWTTYYGATMYDINQNGNYEILISMIHILSQQTGRFLTNIYIPDSTSSVYGDFLVPNSNKLYQNFPNPFNPTTQISYSIAENDFVTLKVYDILGKEVATLVDERQSAGRYSLEFNGSNLPSGIYVYKLTSGNFSATKKLILMK